MAGTNDDRDVLIVAGSDWAYPCFTGYAMTDDHGNFTAYICQAGRSFRPEVDRLGYYANGAIQPELPAILARRDHVALAPQTARAWRATGDSVDARFAAIVERAMVERAMGDRHPGPVEQIFLLSGPDDPRTVRIGRPISNTERTPAGRRIAWTRGHRYVAESVLLTNPETTGELTARVAERTPGGAGS